MASGFFALLDDIAVLMDDVAVMGKVATKKTAGILGDDLAVNAEKASGFVSSREMPVLWAIGKGSLLNKIIICPIAFLLSAFAPGTIIPILVLGGLYLAFEGAEKIYEFFVPHDHPVEHLEEAVTLTKEEVMQKEQEKIRSAILTDFILSIEIIIIALGTVAAQPLLTQILVVSFVAIVATVGVYGIVAIIVRIDDVGYSIIKRNPETGSFLNKVGRFLVNLLPKIIKSLSVIGTLALLSVSGGIFVHNIHYIHDLVHSLPSFVGEFLSGLVIGAIVLVIVLLFKKVLKLFKKNNEVT